MAVRVIENVPAGQVDKYVRLLADAGASSVEKRREPDGEYTIVASYTGTGEFESALTK